MNDIIRVENLKKHYPVKKGFLKRVVGNVKAIDGVDLQIKQGETLGLVGESGCGKTTLGKVIDRLLEPSEGKIFYKDKDITHIKGKELINLRKEIQIVFQNPKASIDPRLTIADIIAEPLKEHRLTKNKEELRQRVCELIDEVGIKEEHLSRYRFAFSGGQLQRITIARTLSMDPKIIVLDEPTSALDVSVQARVLKLLKKLQRVHNLTYLFISHDLAVISVISDRIAVMYLGKIVEIANTLEIFKNPKHPYTMALLSSNPEPIPKHKPDRIILKGEIPSPLNPPKGCGFHPRCPFAKEICKSPEPPPLKQIGNEHMVRCHFTNEVNSRWAPILREKFRDKQLFRNC